MRRAARPVCRAAADCCWSLWLLLSVPPVAAAAAAAARSNRCRRGQEVAPAVSRARTIRWRLGMRASVPPCAGAWPPGPLSRPSGRSCDAHVAPRCCSPIMSQHPHMCVCKNVKCVCPRHDRMHSSRSRVTGPGSLKNEKHQTCHSCCHAYAGVGKLKHTAAQTPNTQTHTHVHVHSQATCTKQNQQ